MGPSGLLRCVLEKKNTSGQMQFFDRARRTKAEAVSSAALRNDKQKGRQRQRQSQIPPLRCGMTTRFGAESQSKGQATSTTKKTDDGNHKKKATHPSRWGL
jgi:hypothetical protein